MVRSMTGYGRSQQQLGGYDILLEIRSVNHRYFEFSCKTPRMYGYLEDRLKAFVQERVSRGKIQVNLYLQRLDGGDEVIAVNRAVAQGYLQALREVRAELDVDDDIALSDIARLPDVFAVRRAQEDPEAVWSLVAQVAEAAVDEFLAMRAAEGERMKDDILARAQAVLGYVAKIEAAAPQTVSAYRDRLYAKLQELLGDRQIDEGRLLTEAALFADKVATDEETVRLRSHVASLEEILAGGEAVGRKLDFLVQEFNREANTIGSKCSDVAISKLVVEMKSEIEKMREQVQNIE
ncbi:YicC family protein [bacterium 210820-DFI.6.52]|uniref:TIGR00255 family protein n=1 Tax=Bittarella massiliensis (ex Durand et al. 2017) TaxID=1720313 RepID=A0AAQ1MBB3_9FIRM|nr:MULTISPECIES: YicC/YloC family endoribonuclease [Eubacteriales]MCB5941302.1 YicC family protein [bacterium 210820-DFI.6.52]ERI99073.1 TIGR00255 family protein [Clostridium sp. ATCC 29733]MZL68711.1 YicC family protein [Bittarella massiliensis (ex Durand et al. 2017)]MZL81695.1 YicC family protein [Bittarella massiliensis (ex Durand et al. 2017)]SHF69598.1 TIGR00255 family protein [Bittarella massiliensis (ex Durand et al. 2017)]